MSLAGSRPVVVEQRVRARPETVFAYFTDPDAYRRWMGDHAELEPQPGGLYRVRFEDGSVAEGTYETVEAPRRVVFTWGWVDSTDLPPGSTRVEVTLRPDGDGTVVRVEHHGLPSEAWRDEHEKGWRHYLARLGTQATEGGAPMQMPKPTDADKETFRALVPDDPRVTVKPMFGNLGAFVNGNMFMGLFGSDVGVKLAPDDAAELLAVEGAGPFGPTERPMGGYVSLPRVALTSEDGRRWVGRALEHVAAIPAKEAGRR